MLHLFYSMKLSILTHDSIKFSVNSAPGKTTCDTQILLHLKLSIFTGIITVPHRCPLSTCKLLFDILIISEEAKQLGKYDRSHV